ncbi:hypothetical protein [Pseudorhodoferax sp.]|uniref:hypothetical protein n=1 Tax=Pseudorhodoferax sp. TaxID=1993553 RepID=UPI002DD636D2|nr:hypothetical protein [Pseudorhodoferax sp.]
MELNNYLLHALLIAACIPILDVIATWYFAFGLRRRDEQAKEALAGQNEAPDKAPADAALARAPAPSSAFAALPLDLAAQVHRLGVGFDGRQFTYAGHTYDRAADAVAYADRVLGKSNALKERLLGQRPFR